MERIAFHLRIRDGKRAAYREAHEDVPDALEAAYLESGAGIERYSVFEHDGHVFGYLELEDPERLKDVQAESDAQRAWDEGPMAGVLEPADGEESWMDEVYRME